MDSRLATLAIQDPPYNIVAFDLRSLNDYIDWCTHWVRTTTASLASDASFYVWLGADQKAGFQPLPDFMVMMRSTDYRPRSYITVRNQRGYGTQRNWMAVRQELLYYVKGSPSFHVAAEYTEIPRLLRGYYKKVGDTITETSARSKSECIRAGNVWVDVQQVFYRLEENVNGCYAQKPLKSCERIVRASSQPGDVVIDFFTHSGSTLLACEVLNRACYTADIDPVFCEIAIRRLEQYRKTGKRGWQNDVVEQIVKLGFAFTAFRKTLDHIFGDRAESSCIQREDAIPQCFPVHRLGPLRNRKDTFCRATSA